MKKNLFSQILSIGLVLCMVIALLPAVNVAAAEETPGISITYPISSQLAYDTDATPPTNIKYTSTDSKGRIEWHSSTSSISGGIGWSAYALALNLKDGEYAAMKIRVPKAGKYTITQQYAKKTAGTKGNMYILNGDVSDISVALSSATPVMTVDFYGETATTGPELTGGTAPYEIAEWTAPFAGEYLVVWKGTGDKNSMGRYTAALGDLTLSGGNGKAPIYANFSLSKDIIDLAFSESAEISVNTVYMSDGTSGEIGENASVTFESSDVRVATISGTTVMGVSAGVAKIYAKSGDCIIGEADVKVLGPETVVINFANDAISGENGSSPETWTVTDNAFSIVLDKTMSGDGTVLNDARVSDYTVSKLHTGHLEWPARAVADTSFTIKKNFAYAGYYSVKFLGSVWNANSQYAIYINGEYAGDYNFYDATVTSRKLGSEKTLNTIYVPSGDIEISFRTRHRYYSGGYSLFSPITLTLTPAEKPQISNVESEVVETLEVGTSADIATKVKMTDGTYRYFGYTDAGIVPTEDNIIKVESSKTEIVSVSNIVCVEPSVYKDYTQEIDPTTATYKLTANKPGDAVITVTAIVDGDTEVYTKTVTVPDNAPGEAVSDEVSIYITGSTGGTVSATGVETGNVVTAEAGKLITAEAEADEDYKFAYWKDSAGNVVSESETYTFRAYTNTSIIAVFDNISETNDRIGVEFFDGNRDYLGFVAATKGDLFGSVEAPEANLTGYEFTGWSIAADTAINAVLRAVALYEEEGNTVSGVKINGNEKNGTKYDDEITETVEGAKVWYRDDKLVGYGDTYTYYVWGNTVITSSEDDVAEKLPLAVLNTSGDAYMLEYDNAGYEIVDAGILFGDDTHNTVNACYYKAKVKNIKNHGQFTAKKSADTKYAQTVVRGYVMFKDADGALRVIYSK